MFNRLFSNSGVRCELPPLTLSKKDKSKKKWKQAVMDAFESIAREQIIENSAYNDFYRMCDGDMSLSELKDVAPGLSDNYAEALADFDIPSYLKHYDIIGILINTLVGKWEDFKNNHYVTDVGEVAQNDYLRFRDEEFKKLMSQTIDNAIKLGLAKKGLTPEGKEFSSQEEQQAFMQQVEAEMRALTPKDTKRDSGSKFKTAGVKWAKATLERDEEIYALTNMFKEAFRDYLLRGKYCIHNSINHDSYKPERWDVRTMFDSKDIGKKYLQDFEYVGRQIPMTPSQVDERFGYLIDTKTKRELLGGDSKWRGVITAGYETGSPAEILRSNFGTTITHPFKGYEQYANALDLQKIYNMPMGYRPVISSDGTIENVPYAIPDYVHRHNADFIGNALFLDSNTVPRTDLCQVTECYFRAYDLWGYLTYENELGGIETVEVDEDILPEFIKENNIKVTYKESLEDIVTKFEVNTLKWQLRPVIYYGVKIQSPNLVDPLYLKVEPTEFQIKGGISGFDVKLPLSGYNGKGIAIKLDPWQKEFNLCMNQNHALLEKELGSFFIMDQGAIPSEYDQNGDPEDALVNFRNTVKQIGFAPLATSPDGQGPASIFNQFAVHNLSHQVEISTRIQYAEYVRNNAYQAIGVVPGSQAQPTQYVTAEGVKVSNSAMQDQLADLYEEFNLAHKFSLEHHLAVAQYAQSNKKDNTIFYTKSDSSIIFLQEADPNLPLRNLGLVVTEDSKKKKSFIQLQQAILSNNTSGADNLELARVMTSQSMSELIEIAEQERELRTERQQIEYQQQSELINQQSQQAAQLEQARWEREEVSKEKDRQNKLDVETIDALGRASDKDGAAEDINNILKTRNQLSKEQDMTNKNDVRLREIAIKEEELRIKKAKANEDVNLQLNSLKQRQQDNLTKLQIAAMNKN